jgi:hypothetical protein
MKAEDDLPPRLLSVLDRHAGKLHSSTGSVAAALAEILAAYDQMWLDTLLENRSLPANGPLHRCVYMRIDTSTYIKLVKLARIRGNTLPEMIRLIIAVGVDEIVRHGAG